MGLEEKWHGTVGGYTNHKCRCNKCKPAWNSYMRDRNRKRGKEAPNFSAIDFPHGAKGYHKGCGCSICVKGHNSNANVMYHLRKIREDVLNSHGNTCMCCGKMTDKLVLDHIHGTRLLRGLLCHSCNTGIGKLGDNLEGVLQAVEYLKRTPLAEV